MSRSISGFPSVPAFTAAAAPLGRGSGESAGPADAGEVAIPTASRMRLARVLLGFILDKPRAQRGQSSRNAMSRQNSFDEQLAHWKARAKSAESAAAANPGKVFAKAGIFQVIAVLVLINAASSVAIAVNLWIGASGVTSTVVRANELLDEAKETGILPLVKASKTNVTALLTNVLSASSSLQQISIGLEDVNITDAILQGQATAHRILALIDRFTAERRVSIDLP